MKLSSSRSHFAAKGKVFVVTELDAGNSALTWLNATGYFRVSISVFNDQDDVERLVKALA